MEIKLTGFRMPSPAKTRLFSSMFFNRRFSYSDSSPGMMIDLRKVAKQNRSEVQFSEIEALAADSMDCERVPTFAEPRTPGNKIGRWASITTRKFMWI